MKEFAVVLCTAPLGGSEKIARALVMEKLAACVNVSQVRSYFVWEGKLSEDNEELMIIKTERRKVGSLSKRIKELHSYEIPEIIVLPISEGDEAYLQWISDSVVG
ncbi:MAG: divalent-cation tolerance protein CutA [Methanotrichaceae archaeon]|nr:divalent-cation tolerance protein CutA [Methanotrichaceae archaeon]